MGRPKKGDPPKHVSSKESEKGLERESIIHLKGTLDYFNFVNRITETKGIPKTQQFRIAYREWCEREGHGTPPAM